MHSIYSSNGARLLVILSDRVKLRVTTFILAIIIKEKIVKTKTSFLV